MAAGDWYTLYDTATGALRAHTSEQGLPSPALPGVTVVPHGPARQDQGNRWNAATRAWVAIPPDVLIDRLQDIVNHPYMASVISDLTQANRTKLRRVVVWLVGARRYRQQLEDVAIDAPTGWPADPSNVVE
jgi:hypothetical protein